MNRPFGNAVIASIKCDDKDYAKHMDYLHFNPLKHGLVSNVKDWPYSTFHQYVKAGAYDEHWGVGLDFVKGVFGDA